MDEENVNDPFYIPMLTPELSPNLNVSNSDETKLIEGSGSFSPKPLNIAEWMIFF
jgi:hypothetical protein